VVSLAYHNNGDTGAIIAKADGTSGNRFLYQYVTTNEADGYAIGGTVNTSTVTEQYDYPMIHTAIVASGGGINSYKNGLADIVDGSTGTNDTAAGLTIGGRRATGDTGTGFEFTGGIGEIILYNKALSLSETQDVETYVADKFGVPYPFANWIDNLDPEVGTSLLAQNLTRDVYHSGNEGEIRLWLDAALGVTLNGSNVSSWADQSGYGYDASQGTADNQPLYVASGVNGLPSIRFDGSNDYLGGSYPFSDGVHTILMVAKTLTHASYKRLMIAYPSTGNLSCLVTDSVSNNYLISTSVGENVAYNTGQFNVIAAACLDTSHNYITSDNVRGATKSQVLGAGSTSAGNYTLGSRIGDAYWNGEIAEVIVVTGANINARYPMQTYLADKYNITLS